MTTPWGTHKKSWEWIAVHINYKLLQIPVFTITTTLGVCFFQQFWDFETNQDFAFTVILLFDVAQGFKTLPQGRLG